MAGLTSTPPTSSCCSTDAQAACCEPEAKEACCATAAAGDACGCAAGRQPADPAAEEVRETVRARYAAAALAVQESGGCCGGRVSTTDAAGSEVFGGSLYTNEDAGEALDAALNASLGCG